MSDHTPEDINAARAALWSHLENERVGLLWVKPENQHPQPMTLFADPDTGSIWFITAADTDLFGYVGDGVAAGLTLQADNNHYIASLSGKLEAVENPDKLDALWSFAVAAWFEDGRDDARVRLLRFTPVEASVWASQNNPVIVGLKMMAAAAQDGESHPDIGTHDVFRLNLAA